MKSILDPCCGSRMFYFDKRNPNVLFCDIRENVDEILCDGRKLIVDPDLVMDVTKLDFPDNTFSLVIFDPPHLKAGSGWQVKKYGKLPKDWKTFLSKSFNECWRVLKPNGTLIFKWNEFSIPLKEVLNCFSQAPIAGNKRPKSSMTHWLIYFKGGEESCQN